MSAVITHELNIAAARKKDREQIMRAVGYVNRGQIVWITEDGKRIAAVVSLDMAEQIREPAP